ncbi:MAG: tryptophan synthase subunit alpha [Thermoguttaceae bacterium]|nr:tryptophan synthase subunit alpha [Thermoguttaceae bacterium]
MNRIAQTFYKCQQEQRAAIIGFLTCGDPNPEDSFAILDAACSAGLDILELGVPFSDPTADGPVIQRASLRALESGITLGKCLSLAKALRKKHPEIPIVLFGYFNPILAYGPERLVHDAMAAGIDAFLCVDLPVEQFHEISDFQPPDCTFDPIRLIAPTTTDQRMKNILPNASGFIYLQSRSGVTGVRNANTQDRLDFVRNQTNRIRQWTNLPIVVGFGISTPNDVAALSPVCDGIVVGSALILLVEKHNHQENQSFDRDNAIRELTQFIASLNQASYR